jgi:hypothetical protein
MLSNYKFEEVERQNCFEDGVNGILYFPITDSEDFPLKIREKAEEIIGRIVHTHDLDVSKLCLNARIVVFSDINGKWLNEISIVISDSSAFDGTWIEEEYIISHEDSLYVPFKTYFMKQIEEIVFSI